MARPAGDTDARPTGPDGGKGAERDPGRRTGRWTRIVLVVSLALNLAVAGVVVGGMLFHGGPRGPGPHGADGGPSLRGLGPTPFLMALDPDDREALAAAARERAVPWRENRDAMRDRLDRMLDLIRAQPFDAAAVTEALAALRLAGAERQALGEALLVDRLDAMTPAARTDYADRIAEGFDRRRRPRP